MTAQEVIEHLNLEPLPEEGGFYRQTFKSKGGIPQVDLPGAYPPKSRGDRAYSTAIYYLVTAENFSALHRIPQVEIFHFYLGDPVEMVQITSGRELKKYIIGKDLFGGQEPQVIVPENVWQATRLVKGGEFALLGCTVSPGFEFADLEIKSRTELLLLFPEHEETIKKFTRV